VNNGFICFHTGLVRMNYVRKFQAFHYVVIVVHS
jgi:hypothetical protein